MLKFNVGYNLVIRGTIAVVAKNAYEASEIALEFENSKLLNSIDLLDGFLVDKIKCEDGNIFDYDEICEADYESVGFDNEEDYGYIHDYCNCDFNEDWS